MLKNFFKHLNKITQHRFKVFILCCKCGMFWRGLTHDLSKYSATEFWEGVKYYSGTYSPIVNCRNTNGYSLAWIHHKNKNKHHLEYWYDRENNIQINMPFKYAVESVCDKIAATKCYNRKNYKPEMVLEHWQKWGSQVQTNENMKNFFTKVFTDLVNKGEKFVLNKKYLKSLYNNAVLKK